MKYFCLIICFLYTILCASQTIVNPVFERTDHYELHVDKIEVNNDSTFVYCTLSMDDNSWANISPNTFIEDIATGKKYTIIRSEGIPFSPAVRNFNNAMECKLIFVFPSINGAKKINLIENPDKESFNIYGISLTECYEESHRMSEMKLISTRASFYDTACDTIRAIQYKEQERNAVRYIYGVMSKPLLEVVFDLCDFYEKYGFNQKAMAERQKLEDYIDNIDDNQTKWQLLSSLSDVFSQNNNQIKALEYGAKAVEIGRIVWGTEHPKYATSLHDLSINNYLFGNYEDAIPLGLEALKIRKKVLGPDHPDYLLTLSDLAVEYSANGNFAEAIRLGTEALEITKKVLGTEHSDYVLSLSNLVGYYSSIGNYNEAIRLGTEALELSKRVLGTEHPDYILSLNNLAVGYLDIGNYNEAIRLGTEVLELNKRVLGTEHPNYVRSLINLASCYSKIGNYTEAIRLGTEALELSKRVLGTDHPDYAISLSNLAGYYADVGNYAEAIRLGTEALEIRKKILGTDHPDYALSLSNLANYYSDIGNYTEAIRLETEALNIRKKVLGTEHPHYALSLNNLASCYSDIGNYTEAIRLGTEALNIRKKILGTEHPDYALSLSNLANYYSNIGNYTEAIRLGTEALNIRKKILGTDHPDYAVSLSNLAYYYSCIGDYTEAIRLGTEALNIRKKILGTDHPHYARFLSNLAKYYFDNENYLKAYDLLRECIEGTQVCLLRFFSEQSSHLKETFWRNKYEYIYTCALPMIASKNKSTDSLKDLYSNTCLFAKGLLLNSEIELRKQILESGDSALIDKYIVLSTNISIYNKLIEKPINERFMNLDSLNQVIEKQEMELVHESKVYGDYTHNLTCSWEDVRSKLGKADIAIEFISFPILGTDSTIYAALTLKKDYDSPHMVTLFEKGQLMNISDTTYYTQTSIYDIVWKPLEEELENIHNIFFSPSGELHRIGIEYIPINKTDKICDKYSLHRLSSTRQLAFVQNGTKGEQTVLYGGIDYNTHERQEEHDGLTMPVGTAIGNKVLSRSNVDSLSLRSSIDYLEGTKREADKIADQMKQHQIHFLYYSGANGSEESFKRLDGTKPKVIHIATHGFYLTESEAKQSKIVHPYIGLTTEDNYRFGHYVEDKSMTRSGLLFSGCNHAINHEHIPEGVEDGILTAQEISNLDLRGLDLVVLSACQTALGDITSGEGVFGLQRGFKKAGAQTIIMSLWKVDDEATMKLMTSFYHHYLEGMTKEKAFRKAQNELRQVSPSMQTKPDWASFIMLDGIN